MERQRNPKNLMTTLASCWGPAWRWQLASILAEGDFLPTDIINDPIVRTAGSLIRTLSKKSGSARCRELQAMTSPAGAALILERTPEMRSLLILFVLAGCDAEEIGHQFATCPETIRMWEGLFFDVRGRMDARAWIQAQIIDPEIAAGRYQHATQLRLALHGGVEVVRSLVGTSDRHVSQNGDGIQGANIRWTTKPLEILEQPVRDWRHGMAFLRQHFNNEHREKQLLLKKARLEFQRTQAARKHELAEKRLELERQKKAAKVQQYQQLLQAAERLQEQAKEAARAADARVAASELGQLRWNRPSTSAGAQASLDADRSKAMRIDTSTARVDDRLSVDRHAA